MPLVLTLHRARDPSERQRESRTLDGGSLTIGRGPGNGWVLQDPAQHLSKTHCTITATPAGYVLTDCSSNGVFLNGSSQRMPRDSQVLIGDGTEFTLGDYLISVREVDVLTDRVVAASAAAQVRGAPPAIDRDDPFGLDEFLAPPPPPPPPSAMPPRAAPPPADPFADPARFRRDDPFGDDADDLLGTPAPAARPFSDPAPPPSRALRDPFDVAAEREGSRTPRVHDPFGDGDEDLFRGARPTTEWQGPSQPDNADAQIQAYKPPRTAAVPSADAWDDLLGDTPPDQAFPLPGTPAPDAPVAGTPAQALSAFPSTGRDVPPAPAAPVYAAPAQPVPAPASPPQTAFSPAPPPMAQPPAPPASAADAARLVQAFLEGAGVPQLDVSRHDPEAYMRAAGELFGTMVESLRDVLMSRSAVKGEFGVEQTMLRPRDNNALKFSVTPADAVAALLQPGRPGYMEPLRATKEAFDDVRLHQLAVMAGVQAALFNLLRTFDPAALEARLQKGGMIESLVPSTRRARLWEAFCTAYRDIARDADSDFQAVFGREFARAYTEQVRSI